MLTDHLERELANQACLVEELRDQVVKLEKATPKRLEGQEIIQKIEDRLDLVFQVLESHAKEIDKLAGLIEQLALMDA